MSAPSRACYLRGCDHPACRDKHLRYCKEYDLRRHHEGRRRIDGAPAAARIRELLAADWTQTSLAAATGVSTYTIGRLASGTHTEAFRETAEAILAFQPTDDTEHHGYWTDPTGTIRRIRALNVIGHPQYAIADAIGISRAAIRPIAAGQRQKVAKDVARKVAALYPQWITKAGDSPTARGMAIARGWYGPLAWDNIDDPDAQPDTDGLGYQPPSPKRDELRSKEIAHLAGFGLSAHTIANQVGLPVKDVAERINKFRAAATRKAEAAA
jgi:plasmid maintenance system antidote protein VapI